MAYLAGWLDCGAVQLHRGVRLRDEPVAGPQVPGQRRYDAGPDCPLSTNAGLDDDRVGGRSLWCFPGFDPPAASQETGIARLHRVAGGVSREPALHLRPYQRGGRDGSADGDHERRHRGAAGFLQLVLSGHGPAGRASVSIMLNKTSSVLVVRSLKAFVPYYRDGFAVM